MTSSPPPPTNTPTSPTWQAGPIIVGAGPSGLAVAACLSSLGIPSTLLERNTCIVSLWQQCTYDRLKLHLPKRFCELPLMGFPKDFPKYPSKDQFISYMEQYTNKFDIKPRFSTEVVQVHYDESIKGWRVCLKNGEEMASKWLIVATGENADPMLPEINGLDRFEGHVIHTCGYRSGMEFEGKKVLVIGCGNSGMEVSLDLCRYNARPSMVVRNAVHILPREIFGFSTFGVAMALLKRMSVKLVDIFLLTMTHFILGDTDRWGLRRPKIGPIELKNLTGKTPVLDAGTLAQIKSGRIKVVGGVKEITKNGAKFIDGSEERFDSVILATGYKSNVPSWLKDGGGLFAKDGMPKTPFPNGWKGEHGLYSVGFTRRGLLGTSMDAMKISKDIHLQWSLINPN
ncbi:putative indole-3-pyruvate monooxygenase YUCCA4 [Carex littledalei]|uniref:Flavin-containing monooxygenase n=1 Tax=Carex littledalei TaxID=544730 RepID=A0A833RHJ4_9POAL|nr:putative indole-3-pyruvate monooxygenase YUCCA4 [Carex littledalei]